MKMKVLFPVVLIAFVLLFMPAMVLAGNAPFYVDTEAEYYDGVKADGDGEYVEAWDPSELPINSSTWVGGGSQSAEGTGSLSVNGTGFSMYVHAMADGVGDDPSKDARGYAEASHYMYLPTVTGTALEFSYDYVYDLYAESNAIGSSAYHEISANLTVWGPEGFLYNGTVFFDSVNALDIDGDSEHYAEAGTFYVPVTVGNWYDVTFKISETAAITGDAFAGIEEESLNIDYQVNVVPEPVSSTLFLVGAAALGYRSFRKRVSG